MRLQKKTKIFKKFYRSFFSGFWSKRNGVEYLHNTVAHPEHRSNAHSKSVTVVHSPAVAFCLRQAVHCKYGHYHAAVSDYRSRPHLLSRHFLDYPFKSAADTGGKFTAALTVRRRSLVRVLQPQRKWGVARKFGSGFPLPLAEITFTQCTDCFYLPVRVNYRTALGTAPQRAWIYLFRIGVSEIFPYLFKSVPSFLRKTYIRAAYVLAKISLIYSAVTNKINCICLHCVFCPFCRIYFFKHKKT